MIENKDVLYYNDNRWWWVMEAIIEIKDLYEQPLFDHLQLSIPKGSITSLVGKNSCGKTTLMKMIAGLIPYIGEIRVNHVLVNKQNKKEIQKQIGILFENPDTNFIGETPREDLTFLLRNMGYTDNQISEKIMELLIDFPIQDLLDMSTTSLSGGEKQLVALATVCASNPSILILDDAFAMLDGVIKAKMFKLLKRINRKKKTTILYVTHHLDDTLFSNTILLMDQGKIILQGKKETVFQKEKSFKKAGLELPFMASLSLKLQFYGLIDHMILDMDKMVNTLWK